MQKRQFVDFSRPRRRVSTFNELRHNLHTLYDHQNEEINTPDISEYDVNLFVNHKFKVSDSGHKNIFRISNRC
jgi:hypothetical protein